MKVLILEDEELAFIGIKALLESKRHQVDVFQNASDALDSIKRKAYDILLIDIMVPHNGGDFEGVPIDQTGIELIVKLREGKFKNSATESNVNIIAITAVSEAEKLFRIEEKGNIGLIQKPIAPEDVFEKINLLVKESIR